MYLFFDTETNGLPKDYKAPASNLENWPRLLQLAWAKYDDSGHEIACRAGLVYPRGFIISKESEKIHGISMEMAAWGESVVEALHSFMGATVKADFLVAHNLSFDRSIVSAEVIRMGEAVDFLDIPKHICTQLSSTEYCKIAGPYGYKWPKLSELHMHLFGKDFEGAHDALVDVRACARCFFELKERGVIVI